MIEELTKYTVKKSEKNGVFEGCDSWIKRLQRMSANDGNYLK